MWADPILTRSFVLLDRVGMRRERRLWMKGLRDWAAFRSRPRAPGFRPEAKAHADRLLARASEAVQARGREEFAWLALRFPGAERWRLLAQASPRIAFLDIETTGGSGDCVTVVGVHSAEDGYRAFIRERSLVRATLQGYLDRFDALVTFNGAGFDVPVLAGQFPGLRMPPLHVDLRNSLGRLGHSGGLKRIEVAMGIRRPERVRGLTGWDAVKLWRSWYLTSDRDALDTLLEYNRADVENLEPLARYAFHELARTTLLDGGKNGVKPLAAFTRS